MAWVQSLVKELRLKSLELCTSACMSSPVCTHWDHPGILGGLRGGSPRLSGPAKLTSLGRGPGICEASQKTPICSPG